MKLLELGDCCLREARVGELAKGVTPPQSQRVAECVRCLLGLARRQRVAPALGHLAEPLEVKLARPDVKQVPVSFGQQDAIISRC